MRPIREPDLNAIQWERLSGLHERPHRQIYSWGRGHGNNSGINGDGMEPRMFYSRNGFQGGMWGRHWMDAVAAAGLI